VLVLAARHRVQVEHAVQAGVPARPHRTVQPLETFREQLERCRVAFEVLLVDRQPHARHAQRRQQPRVLHIEERVQQAVEEPLRPLVAQHTGDGLPHRALVGGIAGDEVLHVHPAADPDAAQQHPRPARVDHGTAFDAQKVSAHCRNVSDTLRPWPSA